MSKANEDQVSGDHYKKLPIEPWDYVFKNHLDYFQGSIIKYITRWRDKGGIDDLRKAKHFLEKYIEAESELVWQEPVAKTCELSLSEYIDRVHDYEKPRKTKKHNVDEFV